MQVGIILQHLGAKAGRSSIYRDAMSRHVMGVTTGLVLGGGGARADQLCICIQSIVTFDYLTIASVGGLVQTPMSFSGMATEPLGGLR